jgi:hypothetical protein
MPAIHFRTTVDGSPDDVYHASADGEIAMCGYTWALIIDRLDAQVGRGERAPYFSLSAGG